MLVLSRKPEEEVVLQLQDQTVLIRVVSIAVRVLFTLTQTTFS